jgi:hypothetical protein
MVKRSENNGSAGPQKDESKKTPPQPTAGVPAPPAPQAGTPASKPAQRRGSVAKVSHTLSIALAARLEEFAFFQRVSESAVIEYSLAAFFAQSGDDVELGDLLRRGGAGRRRKS